MEILLTVIHILVSIFMIMVVLLQPGKGGGMGAAFGGGGGGGGGGQSVFGSKGATPFLNKMTWVSAVIFVVTSISLTWSVGERAMGGNDSVFEGVDAAPALEALTDEDLDAALGATAAVDGDSAADAATDATADSGEPESAPAEDGGEDSAEQ